MGRMEEEAFQVDSNDGDGPYRGGIRHFKGWKRVPKGFPIFRPCAAAEKELSGGPKGKVSNGAGDPREGNGPVPKVRKACQRR
jgi:hypothetical protein